MHYWRWLKKLIDDRKYNNRDDIPRLQSELRRMREKINELIEKYGIGAPDIQELWKTFNKIKPEVEGEIKEEDGKIINWF